MNEPLNGVTSPQTARAPAAGTPVALRVAGRASPVRFVPERLVIAGYTGRDQAGVQRHVDELQRQGIAPPETVPTFYPVAVDLLRFGDTIDVDSDATSGEVEPVLFCTTEGWFVGVGSDHTDRNVERESVARSKQSCPKVASIDVLPYEQVRAEWDHLGLRCFAGDDREPYQDAPLGEILPVTETLKVFGVAEDDRLEGLVMFLGTVPTIGGDFRFRDRYTCQLLDRGGDVLLEQAYQLQTRD